MVDDADQWDLWRAEKRRAAKPYRCGDCRRDIAKGEQYHWGTGLMDGRWTTCRTCLHCQAAGWWLTEVCGGFLLGYIGDELCEHWQEGYCDLTLGRMIVGWRRKWRRWDGTLMPVPTPRKVVWADSKSAYDRQILRYEVAA